VSGAAGVLALDPYVRDWADLLLRWLHVIAAIAWIGTSFYFVLLDQSLRPPKKAGDEEAGVGGELWEVHGGGFYHVQKYKVAPQRLPQHLAWFKWEAYTTWLSGFGLLIVLYYVDARANLVDPTVADLSTGEAVAISVGLLAAAWIVYDLLCRILRRHELWLGACILGLTTLAAWGTSQLFAPRAAFLQVGAMLGTIMAANVLFVIIPAHKDLIRTKEAGDEADARPLLAAKQRSVHNNYLTLPVLLTMLAGHFTVLFTANRAWLVLVALMLLGAWARLFFNLRHAGDTHWWMPVAWGVAVVLLAIAVKPRNQTAAATPADVAAGKKVFATAGCTGCHTLADAGSTGDVGPNLDATKPSEALVLERVTNGLGGMPSFHATLSQAQIQAVAAYVSSVAGK